MFDPSKTQEYANILVDPGRDLESKVSVVSELKESIETFHSSDYPRYLAHFQPAFNSILAVHDSAYSKLKNITLEIIHRFPHNEALKPYSQDIMKAMLYIIQYDNEENALLALKIIVDLHKNYKGLLEDFVQPFLDLVKEMYQNMEETVELTFSDSGSKNKLSSSMYSFKVLTECPVIIALLFSLHRKFVTLNVPIFVPLIVKALMLQPKHQRELHEKAKSQNTVVLSKSPLITQTAAYFDLKALQVKTVSFIAYVLRSFFDVLKPYQENVAEGVMMLMQDCPPDASATRKELLVATRHLWYTNFRISFLPHIDSLLNDDVLIGTGLTCRESLRPLAHSVLVDLIHHVKNDLSSAQISRVIYIYSKDLHDAKFQPQVQTMCAKLLLSMAETIVKQSPKSDARRLLYRILDAFASRLSSLREILSILSKEPPANDTVDGISNFIDIELSQPIQSCTKLAENSKDTLKDFRLQFKNVLIGAKTILLHLKQANLNAKEANDTSSELSFLEEMEIFSGIFRNGLSCFQFYFAEIEQPDVPPSHADSPASINTPGAVISKDEKETLENFASIFTFVEPYAFQEVFNGNIETLLNASLNAPSLMIISQYFSATSGVSSNFLGLLLRYLVDNLEDLGSKDKARAYLLFKHFKLAFMAVTAFPEQNEPVLRPYLAKIIMNSLKFASQTTESAYYFWLLRALFRSIGGGRFESLYQEVFPLLQVLLENLNSLLLSAHSPQMRELFVELCLTVPVRLSVLLPHLNYLMRPLVIALQAGPELVSQSLRTLELCIDNLNQEFLEPIISPVIQDLMTALWKHLKPAPYNQTHSHTAMRILGKFGGRNRRILRDNSPLNYNTDAKTPLNIKVFLTNHEQGYTLNIRPALDFATDLLSSTEPIESKRSAFKFVCACIPLILDTSQDPHSFDNNCKAMIRKFKNYIDNGAAAQLEDQNPFIEAPDLPRQETNMLEKSLSSVLNALFISAKIDDMADEAWRAISNLIDYFALIAIGDVISCSTSNPTPVTSGFELLKLHALSRLNGFIDAIIKAVSYDDHSIQNVAKKVLLQFHQACVSLLGSQNYVDNLAVFRIIMSRFSSCCYQAEWFVKTGGCFGLGVMCCSINFSPDWLLEHELEIVKALLYVLKDVAGNVVYFRTTEATSILDHILTVCHSKSDENETAKFNSLLSLLVSELGNSNKFVRDTIQELLNKLAKLKKTNLPDLLTPWRDRLVAPIFTKPLRALPFALQIGRIDAITYCLSLHPSFLSFSEELIRLLHEALALADAEDQALASKSSQFKSSNSVVNLRVVCIKLLSAAMMSPEFSSSPREATTRARIIAVFFKYLYTKSPEVVEVANEGLRQVLQQQHKLPKDLLQSGLRPILVNLSDHKRLTVAGLEGLARLLELLTNYFKVEIGKKLLDHLKQWATPDKLEEASGKPILDIEEIKIIVAILDIFHLLPSAANIYLDDVIKQVMELEDKLHRSKSSPFRKPLLRFMVRYPEESIEYFLSRINSAEHINLLIGIVSDDDAKLLVNHLKEKMVTEDFKQSLNENGCSENAILLLEFLGGIDPSWLKENFDIVESMREIWTAQLSDGESYGNVRKIRSSASMYQIMMLVYEQDHLNIKLLYNIITALTNTHLFDFGIIKKFVFDKVLQRNDPALVKDIFEYFLTSTDPIPVKTIYLRYLVTPVMMTCTDLSVVSSSHIQQFLTNIWAPVSDISLLNSGETDAFVLELLQLSTLLISRIPDTVSEYRKDVIKFAWALLKVDDITLKQSTYVLLSRFIREYDTPPKIVTQIYVAQLRHHQPEGKNLVKQALDILLPVLPHRFPPAQDLQKVPVWIQWIRKVLVDDGHNVTQLAAIYQLIIRNADQFYQCREHFMMQIVSSLAKLGLSSNSTPETRLLTIELAELILKWDKLESEENVDKMDVVADENSANDSLSPSSYRQMVINCMVRFCLALHDPANKPMFTRASSLLTQFFQAWPEIRVPLSQLEKIAEIPLETEQGLNMALIAAETFKLIIDTKNNEWNIENLAAINKCLAAWISSENPQVIELLSSIVKSTYKAIDALSLGETHEKQVFVKTIDSVIQQGLRNMSNISGVKCLLNAAYLDRVDKNASSQLLRPHVTDLMKLLQTLINDANQQPVTGMTESNPIVIKTLLLLLNTQIPHLGEMRKVFVQSLILIIDCQEYNELHIIILGMLRNWIFEETSFPTMKEKAHIAVKMLEFKNYGDSKLFEDYLALVADIYGKESFSRSEMTVRLEHAFLHGTTLPDITNRKKFLSLLNRSIPPSPQLRLRYIMGIQSWEGLGNHFWIRQALDILFGAFDYGNKVVDSLVNKRFKAFGGILDEDSMDIDDSVAVTTILLAQKTFYQKLNSKMCDELWDSLRTFMFQSEELVYQLWTDVFPIFWSVLNPREKHDIIKDIIGLLSQQYHIAQVEERPNVIQAILEGICNCSPVVPLPPALIKYLGETFNCWHIAIEILNKSLIDVKTILGTSNKEEDKIREGIMDALANLYNELSEEDYFCGLWRRRCMFSETNAAISFQQLGLFDVAQRFYESAQSKARTGVLPFSEFEYTLWETNWIDCTKKLQQWDILADLAKYDSNAELLLDASWRLSDWSLESETISNSLQAVKNPPTARKKFYEAFLHLLTMNESSEPVNEFSRIQNRIQEEGIQLALSKWFSLPPIVTVSHAESLHTFQQFVELQEASMIQKVLLDTNVNNLESKSQELKGTLQTWRERLPNIWDDISIWSDLVSWRQHVFSAINKAYIPIIPHLNLPATGNPSSSHAYRGYHETAWIINRFAHVARKHQLAEVCINYLNKIYTLPNIEIQEAFCKLHEQACCHLYVLQEYSSGLDVINNTNLGFFNESQKAEFFTIKGKFFAHLNMFDEADKSFALAIQTDMKLAKPWAAWGEYHDRKFSANHDIRNATEALTCYLNAASSSDCKQPRRYLARILWLLTMDDDQGTLIKAYENFKTEIQVYFWITFIPQLLTALNGKEAKVAKAILMKIAKNYPQALHFQLRTAKEDFGSLKRQFKSNLDNSADNSEQSMKTDDDKDDSRRKPWDHVEEVMLLVKTAFPLLALSMETMVDQILQRLKPTTDEDIYRLIVALLNDGVQMHLQQLAKDPTDAGTLSAATEANLLRFAESMHPNHVKYKEAFENDFIKSKPNLSQLVDRFRQWRDRLEILLDSRPTTQYLEHFSPYLAEFEYQKFDEIEVPGQYFQIRDKSANFIKILTFEPLVDVVRGHSGCHRGIVIRGNDGSLHPFMVQHPAAKQCRREERIIQLYRVLNDILDRQKETRRRNLSFHLPTIVPLAPQIRLVQDDRSYVTLQEIYEDHARMMGFKKDDPIKFHINRVKEVYMSEDDNKRGKIELLSLKTEIMQEVAGSMIPEDVLSKYFLRKMKSYLEFWTMRKRFTSQMASVTFMTYLLSIGHRYPQKFHISCETGAIWASELMPNISNSSYLFTNSEAVPFRLTPNIQHFITPIGLEGVFTSALLSIGRSLTEPVNEMYDYVGIFVRDELTTWQQMGRRQPLPDQQLRDYVNQNVDLLIKRAQALSCKVEREMGNERTQPVNQTILDLISQAVNPLKLAQMDIAFLPQL